MKYFRIQEDVSSGYTGDIDGEHRWVLPGILRCPACHATWSGGSKTYPSVDLTSIASLADFEEARAEPLEEYERLRELVRPLLPSGAVVEPGSSLGPLIGKGQGRFGSFVTPVPWWLLVQREAFERLQAEGLRGLKGCRTELRFRQSGLELLELELLPVGHVHSDCLPPRSEPACARCGRRGIRLPEKLLLDAASLPAHMDVFRLEDFSTVILCTERFVDACRRLGLDGVAYQSLPTR